MKKFYNYGKQHIDQKDIKEVTKSLKNNLITSGKYVEKLEKLTSKLFGNKYSISCSNGTAAIFLALKAINLKKNDNVIIPAINFVSAASMSKILGANVIFADVDKKTFQLSPKNIIDCIEKNKLKKIKVVFTMHLGGCVNYIPEIFNLKKKYNFVLIEDACHALGAKFFVRKKKYNVGCSTFSDFTLFSFHPVKTVTSGEGGLICTNNYFLAKKILVLRSLGIKNRKNYEYNINEASFNFRLSDINCALVFSQLKKLNIFIKKRIAIAKEYKKQFNSISSFLKIINIDKLNYSAWHLLIVEINFDKLKINYDQFYKKLLDNRVKCQLHYKPTYRFSLFKIKNYKFFKNSEKYYKKCISIPIYYSLSLEEVCQISKIIKKIIIQNKI